MHSCSSNHDTTTRATTQQQMCAQPPVVPSTTRALHISCRLYLHSQPPTPSPLFHHHHFPPVSLATVLLVTSPHMLQHTRTGRLLLCGSGRQWVAKSQHEVDGGALESRRVPQHLVGLQPPAEGHEAVLVAIDALALCNRSQHVPRRAIALRLHNNRLAAHRLDVQPHLRGAIPLSTPCPSW
eukprot:TRINITY_DN11627_c0_g1_i1.p1 TRINITY_DN11627_c0_g1~~TRINITY_DN11627_c0_g1_i1.p1  ORF type:complete len:182 (-),score=15.07 TRINITY_DN11627_c0_g1_i1:89-634(-)